MPTARAILPSALLAVTSCSTPQVEAKLRHDCGPLDGPVFAILIPDGEGLVRAYGPNWPDRGDGRYAIEQANNIEPVAISLCDAGITRCEEASYGSFAVTPTDDGGFAGTLQAVFPQGGSRRLTFLAYEDTEYEPPMCG